MASQPVETMPPRMHLVYWRALGGLIGASIVLTAIASWRDTHALLINRTNSLPNWAFFVSAGNQPARGDYLSFVPPRHPLVVRHFGAQAEAWGKIIYGVPGDRVAHRGNLVTINGQVVARLKSRSRFGEPLTPGATGRIPAGCYYAGTPHPDGFDSRYAEIGFVCRSQIVGTGIAIL